MKKNNQILSCFSRLTIFFSLCLIILIIKPEAGSSQEINSKISIPDKIINKNSTKPPAFQNVESYSLVVGYNNPDETYIINSNQTLNGDVVVMNNGKLIIENNAIVDITGNVICLNHGSIIASRCTLSVFGNWYVVNNSKFEVDSTYFEVPMLYRYQFGITATDSALVSLTNTNLSFGNGPWNCSFTGHTRFNLINDIFLQSITASIGGHTELTIDNTQNAWEFLLLDTCNVSIKNSIGFILWFFFHENTTSASSFPQGNYVNGFRFNNTVAGLENITYDVSVDSTANVKWGIIPLKNSSVTINNSSLRTCGIVFNQAINDTISGYVNNQFYTNHTFDLPDRTLTLNYSEIATWNFYSYAPSEITLLNSVFGEAIAFSDGKIRVLGSVCDGTGGYLGANNGNIEILYTDVNSCFQSQGESIIVFAESKITNSQSPVLSQSSICLMANTTYITQPSVLDTSFLLEIFIDTLNGAAVNSVAPLNGTIRALNGPYNNAYINHYDVYFSTASNPASKTLISENSTGEIFHNTYAVWNTTGLTPGYYIIYVDVFVNNDTVPVEIAKRVTLWQSTESNHMTNDYGFKVFPNPCHAIFKIISPDQSPVQSVEIYNMQGQVLKNIVYSENDSKQNTYKISVVDMAEGLYFYRIITQNLKYHHGSFIKEH
ncbi:MAG: T9SS type A sorting domain-containing protein [Bacteroidia bacterium]|nr:T9SS type A sorting domain-containing protein [Bacteroidia bacterium]